MIATIGIVFVACCKARIASSPAVVTTSKAHLTYGFVVVSNDICGAVERALIADFAPLSPAGLIRSGVLYAR